MTEPVPLAATDAAEIAAFSRAACAFDPLSAAVVRRAVFADPDPQLVLGCYEAGLEAVVAAVVRGDVGFLKLLAVHPRLRRRGIGTTLLEEAETWCTQRGARSVQAGGSAPYYLFPGVDVRYTDAVCTLEARGYERIGHAVNMTAALRGLPAADAAVRHADDRDADWLFALVEDVWPPWRAEVELALRSGTCVVHPTDAFACYDVLRDGWLGPMATREDARRRGIGTSTMLGALHAMRERSHERADIAWAGPIAFYSRAVGARISRVFWEYRKELAET